MQGKNSLLKNLFFFALLCKLGTLGSYTQDYSNSKTVTSDYITTGLKTVLEDFFSVTRNLFCRDSLKILTGALPFYLLSRMHDDKLQRAFYDPVYHKNLCEHNSFFYHLADEGIAIPFTATALAFLFSKDCNLHTTSRVFLTSLPLTYLARYGIKKMRFDCCMRPLNQHFDKSKRYYGGFPSGHMLEIAYMTTLYGMRMGPSWGVPMGLYGVFIFSEFLVCNRHYLSQLVAGIGLGVIFGFASNRTIEWDLKKAKNWDIGISQDNSGNTGLKVSYNF